MGGPETTFYRELRERAGQGADERDEPAAPERVAALCWRPRRGGEIELLLVEIPAGRSDFSGFWSFPSASSDAPETGAGGAGDPRAACARAAAESLGLAGLSAAAAAEPGEGIGELVPLGAWPAPALSPRPPTIRVFAVRAPADEGGSSEGASDRGHRAWLTAREALASWRRGELPLAPLAVEIARAVAAGEGHPETAAAALRAASQRPRAYSLAPGIRVLPVATPTLPPATHTNAYILGDRELVVVDPGSPYAGEQRALARVLDDEVASGARVVAAALTHHHPDHVGGVSALAERYGAPVWAHAETAERIGGADRRLADGSRFELAGDPPVEIEALHTPGHAPGHLCFVERRGRWAVAGDMVAGVGTIVIDPDEGDMGAYLQSLRRLRAAELRALLPAHGAPITSVRALLDRYIDHRLWRESRALAALSGSPRPVSELVRTVYDDVPPAVWPLAERSLVAHLEKLAREGRAELAGEGWRSP